MADSRTKLEIGEDDEEFERLQDCVRLLVAAGYFRARVKGLAAFHKLVGGIVWCISTCNHTVDVDLLYAENSTIGQKIALTEKICEVLMRLQCPHALEPHQIQGLDIMNIYPVIQWLVKKAIEAKEMFGDRNKTFVSYLAEPDSRKAEAKKALVRFSDHQFPSTSTKQPDLGNIQSQNELLKSLRSMKKGGNRENADEKEALSFVEEAIRRAKMPEFARKPLKMDGFDFKTSEMTEELVKEETEEDLDRQFEELNAQLANLDEEARNEEEKRQAIEAEYASVEEKLAENEALERETDPELLESLREKFTNYLHIADREAAFKKQCAEELSQIEAQIGRLEENNQRDETENLKDSQIELEAEEEKLAEAREIAADLARKIASLQRGIDSVPSQIEIAQYHKRLIELYNQMGSKHRQTRQYYVYHNYLVDLRNYMKKEAELLNSIEEAVPLAKREDNRDSFINQLTKIMKGVETNLEKHQQQERELDGKKEILSVEIGFQREKERAFEKGLEDFKRGCEAIEQYKEQLRVHQN